MTAATLDVAQGLVQEKEKVPRRVVVLAIGNDLRSDDGVGIHALRRLACDSRLDSHVQLIDGGVMGLDLLPYLHGCESLLIIDAIDAAAAPGELIRLEGGAVPATWEQKLSMHQAGLSDLLALLRMQQAMPARLVIWGVQPESTEWGVELSPAVAGSLDQLIDRILDELRSWGVLQG